MLLHIVNSSLGCASVRVSVCMQHLLCTLAFCSSLHTWSALHCTDFAFMQKSIINRQYFVWFLIVACKTHTRTHTCMQRHMWEMASIEYKYTYTSRCLIRIQFISLFSLLLQFSSNFFPSDFELHLPANDTECYYSFLLLLQLAAAAAGLVHVLDVVGFLLFTPLKNIVFQNSKSRQLLVGCVLLSLVSYLFTTLTSWIDRNANEGISMACTWYTTNIVTTCYDEEN